MKNALLVTLAFTLARLPVAALLELSPDESYYWLWSTRLDLSYFDHPPMVAWGIAAFTTVLGDAEWAVRAFALACSFVTAGALAWSARELAPEPHGDRAALATATLACAMPITHAGAIVITPDSPASACWAVALAALASIARGRTAGWYVAGAAMGVGLLSKYTVVLLGVSLAILLLADPAWRRWLRTPHPWLCAAISFALFAPVVVWNARHDWASFAFQLDHGTASKGGGGLRSFLELAGAQLALATPMVVWLAGKGFRGTDRLLVAAFAPTLGLFLLLSFKSRQEVNWPAAAWLAAAVAAGIAYARGEGRRTYIATVALGAVATIVLSVHAIHPLVPLRKDRLASEFHGWRVRGETARELAGPGVVLGDSYRIAAEIAYYGGGPVDVVRGGGRISMFDFWEKPAIPAGGDAIYVSARERTVPEALAASFESVEPLAFPKGVRGTIVRLQRRQEMAIR